MTYNASDSLLLQRLRRAQRNHPGWHIWPSSSGRIYATGRNAADPAGRMQTTVDAPATGLIGRAIEARETEMGRMQRSAARRAA